MIGIQASEHEDRVTVIFYEARRLGSLSGAYLLHALLLLVLLT